MKLNRRQFIGTVGAIAVVPSASFALIREPYVKIGNHVQFLYFEDWTLPRKPFGPCIVEDIGNWTGEAYEISIRFLGSSKDPEFFTALDTEWSFLREEAADFKWNTHGNYPNIHSYVREKRYGENPEDIRRQMEQNSLDIMPGNRVTRETVPIRNTVW